MLIRPVIVRTVRDGHRHSVSTKPRANKQVRSRFRGRIRAARMIRGLLGELCRIIERKVSVYLVRRNMMKAYTMLTRSLKKRISSFDVRFARKAQDSRWNYRYETPLRNEQLHQRSQRAHQPVQHRKYHPE